MSAKTRRQLMIMEIIQREAVETQEELVRRLREANLHVTQATVSRDIKEMKLVKVPEGDGRYRYALPQPSEESAYNERFLQIFRECVLGYDASENLVVIHTLAATASGVAEAVDNLHAEEVIGTLAGERTVFVVVRPKEAVEQFLRRLRALMR